jgi:hypothetical protein
VPQASAEDEEDDDDFADLPDDDKAEEAAAEQRTLVVSFETQYRDEAARHFMVAERSATANRLTEVQAAAHAATHHRNVEVARTGRGGVSSLGKPAPTPHLPALAGARGGPADLYLLP